MAQVQETSLVPTISLPANVAPKGIAATELRPWGSFTILEEGRGYKGGQRSNITSYFGDIFTRQCN